MMRMLRRHSNFSSILNFLFFGRPWIWFYFRKPYQSPDRFRGVGVSTRLPLFVEWTLLCSDGGRDVHMSFRFPLRLQSSKESVQGDQKERPVFSFKQINEVTSYIRAFEVTSLIL